MRVMPECTPPEDEEISPQEEAAVQEARDELASGAALISHDSLLSELLAEQRAVAESEE